MGIQTITTRSNLPGRRRAGSKTSERLVAPRTITAELLSNPSISCNVSNMLSHWETENVCLQIWKTKQPGKRLLWATGSRFVLAHHCWQCGIYHHDFLLQHLSAKENTIQIHWEGISKLNILNKVQHITILTSSINIIDGASFLARAKRSLTREAPIPTYNSTNSLAEQLIKGTSASPATAFARRVLPVPGRPTCKI